MTDLSNQYVGLDYMLRQPAVPAWVGDFVIKRDDPVLQAIQVDGVPVQAFTHEAMNALVQEVSANNSHQHLLNLPDELWVATPARHSGEPNFWKYIRVKSDDIITISTFLFSENTGWSMLPFVFAYRVHQASGEYEVRTFGYDGGDARCEKILKKLADILDEPYLTILIAVGYFQTRPKKYKYSVPQGNMQQAANAKRARLNAPLLPSIEIVHLTAVQSAGMPRAKNPMSLGGGWTQALHTRSGHVRRYKSGHTVQVKPYVAGRGAPKKIKLVVP